ncbi:MAG: nucleotidyltransferase family protein [Mariprofundaceae bacterium]|nr:nucleotidyltransferase family protein [Mariprofundaceae bacterium]
MSHVERAVVLAAGLGTRLKWLTSGHPKAMMTVGDDMAIVHVIRRLAGQGIHDIAVNTHHHGEKLAAFLGDGSRFGVRLYFSREKTLLDSGGGVRKAMELLPGSGLIAVHNADVIADIDLQRLASRVPVNGASLAMVSNPVHHPAGDFSLLNGNVVERSGRSFTYSGVSVWDQGALAPYQQGTLFPLTLPMRDLMAGQLLTASVHYGIWFDIGRPRDLMQARALLNGRE